MLHTIHYEKVYTKSLVGNQILLSEWDSYVSLDIAANVNKNILVLPPCDPKKIKV